MITPFFYLPTIINNRNLMAIGYLAICGSVIGFITYYLLLYFAKDEYCTLMTPVFCNATWGVYK